MKKLSFLALAAVGLLLGACTDKDDAQPKAVDPGEFSDGAYIGISLQLPSADKNVTRANDELSNGTEAEFAVKNATLYIFKVTKNDANPDKNAEFVDYVTLGTSYEKDNQPGINPDEWGEQTAVSTGTKITSTYSDAALISNQLASEMKNDDGNDYYAYVILNHNGQPNVNTGDKFDVFSKQEFVEIGADIAAEARIKGAGLLMTNAPVCDKPGGEDAPAEGAKYTTLVYLDKTKIYGNKDQAEQNAAACVYVERAAVKITVADERDDDEKTFVIGEVDDTSNGETDDLPITILGWQVINNEPTYFNTRQINILNATTGAITEDWGPFYNDADALDGATNKYRFVSLYKFAPTKPNANNHTLAYRTYFAKDVQYDDNATLQNTVASDDRPWIAAGKHAYTTENTFDVAHQTWRNTTMVTLKVQFGSNGFYTVGKGSQTIYANATNALAAIENIVKDDPAVTDAYNALLDEVTNQHSGQTVEAGLDVDFVADANEDGQGDAPTVGTTDVAVKVTLDFKVGGSSYTAFNKGDEATLKTDLETAIAAVMKETKQVDDGNGGTTTKEVTSDKILLSFYESGISYYNVRIKHFGDVETPWSATGDYISGGGKDVNEIYGIGQTPDKSKERFLGRYGVVRDNWYKLAIEGIGKIGSAEPVDPSRITPDTPDDEIENFISVHVHIVPWVLRSQSVEL